MISRKSLFIFSYYFVVPLIFCIFLTPSIVLSYNSCTYGKKLFAIETGKALCASVSNPNCIEACEWQSSCRKASHFNAYLGRRSYVAGVQLTEKIFNLQCCATLGSMTRLNRNKQGNCYWSRWQMTVTDFPSFRVEPVLEDYQYVRDIQIDRFHGNSKINLRLEICNTIKQRETCDMNVMKDEDKTMYTMLKLRLSRFIQSKKASANVSSIEVKDKTDLENFRRDAKPIALTQPIAHFQLDGNGEFSLFTNDPSVRNEKNGHSNFKNIINTELKVFNSGKNFKGISIKTDTTSEEVLEEDLLIPPASTSRIKYEGFPETSKISLKRIGGLEDNKYYEKSDIKLKAHKLLEKKVLLAKQEHFQTSPLYNNNIVPSPTANEMSVVAVSKNPRLLYNSQFNYIQPLQVGHIKTTSNDKMILLKECCYQTSPRCRDICDSNFSTAIITSSLTRNTCSGLELGNILQCFPRFFNTYPVAECCASTHPSLINFANPNGILPIKCQELCSPNFKLTLEHFGCMTYISTVVECYQKADG
uniref:DB domain-containing protein n=1 Tax=Parastrongyloides trichosuri TaxID=131310 RepID=A0A0N4ZW03_PARTI